jgi:uncharacterized membrane protein YfcA
MFIFLRIVAVLAPFWFVYSFWDAHKQKKWSWINSDSRKMYTDAVNTLITGIAVAVVVSRLDSRNPAVITTSKEAVVCLIVCVVFSMIVILALSRGFEIAQSRNIEEGEKGTQGRLTSKELLFILIPTFIALVGFLDGFLSLGRIAFQL